MKLNFLQLVAIVVYKIDHLTHNLSVGDVIFTMQSRGCMTHPKNNTAQKQCVRDQDNVSKVGFAVFRNLLGASEFYSNIVKEN